jgi:predicted SpoU family rRNA methylase
LVVPITSLTTRALGADRMLFTGHEFGNQVTGVSTIAGGNSTSALA